MRRKENTDYYENSHYIILQHKYQLAFKVSSVNYLFRTTFLKVCFFLLQVIMACAENKPITGKDLCNRQTYSTKPNYTGGMFGI